MSLLESLSDGLEELGKNNFFATFAQKETEKDARNNVQKRGTKHVFVVIVLLVAGVLPATPGAGGLLDGGGPFHRAGKGERRRQLLGVVRQAQLVEARHSLPAALRLRFVQGAVGVRAVRVAHHTCGRRLVPLNPSVVVADNVLVVEARQQRHLPFDAPELLAGWVDLDALHSIVAAIQFVLDLPMKRKRLKGENVSSFQSHFGLSTLL